MLPLATALSLVLAAGAQGPKAAPSAPGAPTAPAPEQPGPVHAIVLKDMDGRDLPLSRFAGTPMVIEIWSTSCGPCVKQRQLMSKLAPEYRGKVVFMGASVDREGAAAVRKHATQHPVAAEFVEALATPPLMQLVATRERTPSIPKVVYVDSRGRMVDVGTSVQSEAWMRAMLKNLR